MEENGKSVWMGAGMFVAVVAGGILLYRFAAAPPPAPTAAVPAAVPAEAAPATPAAPAIPLPKLEESDEFVRGRAAALSSDPQFAQWIRNGDLIARPVAAANMIAAGKIPGDALKFLAPSSRFRVLKRGGKIYMDARGCTRYDMVAAVVASLDAKAAAVFFRDLKPLFQQAYNALGEKGGDVQDVFVRAVVELLRAPNLGDGVELKEGKKGITYVFADGVVESLSPAKKQLLRMGPKNGNLIQSKLRDICLALGVPETQLPAVPAGPK
ncbi:MAG: DUF3014 domain-containing protein [Elusimicrobiota bacterium]